MLGLDGERRLWRILDFPKHLQTTVLVLMRLGKATASEVSCVTGKARAVESAYLNQLYVMKIASKTRFHRRAYFQVCLEGLDW